MDYETATYPINHSDRKEDILSTDPFLTHSDVRRAWPDLFVDVDDHVSDMVVATAADSILEGLPMDREHVQELIAHARHLGSKHSSDGLRAAR